MRIGVVKEIKPAEWRVALTLPHRRTRGSREHGAGRAEGRGGFRLPDAA